MKSRYPSGFRILNSSLERVPRPCLSLCVTSDANIWLSRDSKVGVLRDCEHNRGSCKVLSWFPLFDIVVHVSIMESNYLHTIYYIYIFFNIIGNMACSMVEFYQYNRLSLGSLIGKVSYSRIIHFNILARNHFLSSRVRQKQQ